MLAVYQIFETLNNVIRGNTVNTPCHSHMRLIVGYPLLRNSTSMIQHGHYSITTLIQHKTSILLSIE
uniref:Uncharacterized protein n=1 Tax=Daphnia magna TaxID=35525 RepID=A0A0N8DT54_9CRUS